MYEYTIYTHSIHTYIIYHLHLLDLMASEIDMNTSLSSFGGLVLSESLQRQNYYNKTKRHPSTHLRSGWPPAIGVFYILSLQKYRTQSQLHDKNGIRCDLIDLKAKLSLNRDSVVICQTTSIDNAL